MHREAVPRRALPVLLKRSFPPLPRPPFPRCRYIYEDGGEEEDDNDDDVKESGGGKVWR